MKRLILMRHAKSDWSANGDDHARPLNTKRGVNSARAMGDWLRARGWKPDQVFCSTATRTRQTLDLLGLGDVPVAFDRGLYLTDAEGIARVLRDATGDCVLLLGHNYGIAEFANEVVAAAPAHARFHDYPTCSTTLIEFPIHDWSELDWHSGAVAGFAIPREVMAGLA